MITISMEQDGPIAVGGGISGRAMWVPERQVQVRGLVAQVRWRTEGRGIVNNAVVWQQTTPVGMVVIGSPVEIAFAATLPADGPVSYNGTLLRIIWEVEVHADIPMAADEQAALPFIVVPRWAAD